MKLVIRNTRESRHLDIAEVDILGVDGAVVAVIRDPKPTSRVDDAVADVHDQWAADHPLTGSARSKVHDLWPTLAKALDTLDYELNQR